MTPKIRKLVGEGATHDQIEAQAVEEGMIRLGFQALALARSGVISLSEAYRARLD